MGPRTGEQQPLLQKYSSTNHHDSTSETSSSRLERRQQQQHRCNLAKNNNNDIEKNHLFHHHHDCDNHVGPLTFSQMHHLVHDIHEYDLLKSRLNLFIVYIFIVVLFIGLNLALLFATCKDIEYIEENYEVTYHYFSFWGVFIFTLVEASLLISTNGGGRMANNNSTSLNGDNGEFELEPAAIQASSLTIYASVMASFMAAVMYAFDSGETFEVEAHWIEYGVQLLLSGIDVWFVFSYCYNIDVDGKSNDNITNSWAYKYRHVEMAVAISVVFATIWMMVLYAELWETEMGGEWAAHFVEFGTDVFNGLFALMYAMLSYNDLHRRLSNHYAPHSHMIV